MQAILLTEEELATLLLWRHLAGPSRLALRAEIVLLAAEGRTNQEIASRLRATPKTVALWRRRFLEMRLAGIEKEAPRGKPATKMDDALIRDMLFRMEAQPPNGVRWTVRSLAAALGVSPSLVYRAWKARGIAPWREWPALHRGCLH